MSEAVPRRVATTVRSDLSPVRRLPSPVRRAFELSPLVALTVVAATVVFALRSDAPELGWFLTWGVSIVQALFALALVALGLREAVPGRTLTASAVLLAAAPVLGFSVVATYRTWQQSAIVLAPEAAGWVGAICFTGTVVSAFPLLAAAAAMTARAFPVRPWTSGVLYGLGAGLGADAGWRLFCHYSDPLHVLLTHTGGVAAVVQIGVLSAVIGARRSRS